MKKSTRIWIGTGFVICLIGSNLVNYYITTQNERKVYQKEVAALQKAIDDMTVQYEEQLADLEEKKEKRLAELKEKEEENTDQSFSESEAFLAYKAFLMGQREDTDGLKIGDMTGTTEQLEFIFLDVGADICPELHIRTKEEYLIYTYQDGEVERFKRLEGDVTLYNGGVFISESEEEDGITRNNIFVLEPNGEILVNMELLWQDKNGNEEADEEDRYEYNGVVISKEDWKNQMDKYRGMEKDEIEWFPIGFLNEIP